MQRGREECVLGTLLISEDITAAAHVVKAFIIRISLISRFTSFEACNANALTLTLSTHSLIYFMVKIQIGAD